MTEYYVFDDEQTAVAAEAYICAVGQLPRVGINAATGEPAPTSQPTERWAVPLQRLDSKWVFPRLPSDVLATVPPAVRDYFAATYPHTLEEYAPAWFPESEGP